MQNSANCSRPREADETVTDDGCQPNSIELLPERTQFVEPNAEGDDFAKANGFKRYADFGAAIAHPGVEAVVLATPHSLHAEQIEQAVAWAHPRRAAR